MKLDCYLPIASGLKHNDLITSTGTVAKTEVVYTKQFRSPSCSISLRPFCVINDMRVICSWAWKISRAANMVAASYVYTGDSDFARSFMVLLDNHKPVCQVDICNAVKDELNEYYPSSAGDYIIRILMNTHDKKIRPFQVSSLQTCLEYFFRFTEIEQIIAQPEADNKAYNELLVKAGFSFEDAIYSQYSVSNLYTCTRQNFRDALSNDDIR